MSSLVVRMFTLTANVLMVLSLDRQATGWKSCWAKEPVNIASALMTDGESVLSGMKVRLRRWK
jgi:hypothetical protein